MHSNLQNTLIEKGIDCQVDLQLDSISTNYNKPTRFSTRSDRPGDEAGWAILFNNADGSQVIKAGDYREGIEESFQVTKGALSAAKKETEETRIKTATPLNTVSTQAPAFKYLVNRGLKESVIRELSEDIRILDNVTYWVVDGNKNYKSLMSSTVIASLIKSKETGEMVAWHKIHMDKDGNKPQILLDEGKTTKKVKKVSNNIDMKNSAILIAEAIPGTDWSDAEAVAEGVESAIALRQLGFTGRIYSLSSTAGFKTLVMEPGKKIYMAYEGDPASKKALHDFYINNTDSEVFVFSFGDKTDANDAVLSGVDSLPEAAPYMAFKQGEFKPAKFDDVNAADYAGLANEDEQFEDVQFSANGEVKRVEDTRVNLEILLRRMGVVIRKNEMGRQIEIDFTKLPAKEKKRLGYDGADGLTAKISDITDEAKRVRMPTLRINELVERIAEKNRYHPVVEWIEGTKWDGVSRFEELLKTVTVPGHEEKLKGIYFKRWFISAVAALYERGGVGAEGAIVFSGKHGKGKSRWVRSLLPAELQEDAFKESASLDPKNKDSVAEATSKWIVELGEIDATFRKADIAELKGFITKRLDEFRSPYARRAAKHARRTVFFGTVNEAKFLNDNTGNRRFWPLTAIEINHTHGIDMQQLWAEVRTWYDAGEPWWLMEDERELMSEQSKKYQDEHPYQGLLISTFYDEDGLLRPQIPRSPDELYLSRRDDRAAEYLVTATRLTVSEILIALGQKPGNGSAARTFRTWLENQFGAKRGKDKAKTAAFILQNNLEFEEDEIEKARREKVIKENGANYLTVTPANAFDPRSDAKSY